MTSELIVVVCSVHETLNTHNKELDTNLNNKYIRARYTKEMETKKERCRLHEPTGHAGAATHAHRPMSQPWGWSKQRGGMWDWRWAPVLQDIRVAEDAEPLYAPGGELEPGSVLGGDMAMNVGLSSYLFVAEGQISKQLNLS